MLLQLRLGFLSFCTVIAFLLDNNWWIGIVQLSKWLVFQVKFSPRIFGHLIKLAIVKDVNSILPYLVDIRQWWPWSVGLKIQGLCQLENLPFIHLPWTWGAKHMSKSHIYSIWDPEEYRVVIKMRGRTNKLKVEKPENVIVTSFEVISFTLFILGLSNCLILYT